MRIDELMEKNRRDELIAIFRFIDSADVIECAHIISEIMVCHDNIMAFNYDPRLLAKVDGVCVNGNCVQLNIKKDDPTQSD